MVNLISDRLHDGGFAGTIIGLCIANILIPPIVIKGNWWRKLYLGIVLVLLPINITRWIANYMYMLNNSNTISVKIDVIAYLIYFTLSILIIEFFIFIYYKFVPEQDES